MTADNRNAAEIAAWRGPLGRTWVRSQTDFDTVLAPMTKLALARAAVRPSERVIDIGCGAGATTIELGRRVAPAGQVLGVDVSPPLLARARERTTPELPVTFVEADAATYRFDPGSFDLLFSRFGVMFFDDPVGAFANLRTALRPSGRLAFVCYRAPSENPLLTTAQQAAFEHVPPPPKRPPDAPGLFSFADAARVDRILAGAGFRSITCEPADLMIDIACGHGLDEAVRIGLEFGPVARAIAEQTPEVRGSVAQSVRRAYGKAQQGARVPLAAAVWLVTAVNP